MASTVLLACPFSNLVLVSVNLQPLFMSLKCCHWAWLNPRFKATILTSSWFPSCCADFARSKSIISFRFSLQNKDWHAIRIALLYAYHRLCKNEEVPVFLMVLNPKKTGLFWTFKMGRGAPPSATESLRDSQFCMVIDVHEIVFGFIYGYSIRKNI